MNAQEMMEKAKRLMEKARAVEKAEKEKNVLAFGKILQRHFDENFANLTVDNIRLECSGIMVGTGSKSESKKIVDGEL